MLRKTLVTITAIAALSLGSTAMAMQGGGGGADGGGGGGGGHGGERRWGWRRLGWRWPRQLVLGERAMLVREVVRGP